MQSYKKKKIVHLSSINYYFKIHFILNILYIYIYFIEDFIANNAEITETFVGSLSPQAKSIAAIEYLLFKSDLSSTNTEFVNSQNRRDFLKFSSQFLKEQTDRLQNIWSATGDDYANTFINNTSSGIQGSFNRYFNGLHNLVDTGKVTKVGKPAGLENSAVINPELTQAYFSNTSLDIIKANMESIEKAYYNPSGLGINDYVFSIIGNNDLNDLVQIKINEVKAAVDSVPGNLYDAVITHPTEVENLHTKLEELRILFAVDLQSILSIVITSTDNDGD
ncbi:MAG: imelysin family protein [Flavobacteriaceae bacterium]|nr:imelysin family protein [Flavobacteriaceae bacterium]